MTLWDFKPPKGLWPHCFGYCFPTREYTALKKDDDINALKEKPKEVARLQTDWRKIPLVSHYNLIKQIGKGGFATIWLAKNKVSLEQVALKVVNLKDPDLEPEEVGTLLSEAKFLRSLDCPFLIKCFDTAATDEWLILALEHLPGGELFDHIHKVKKYTEAEAAKMFAQIVTAISYLHNLNVIHRDIKPENVMFTQRVETSEAEGRPLRVKIIDLGMSALYDPNKEIRGCIGTPGFVAPELWNDGPHTPASDVYSLGVVLFVMLTGRKPHSGMDIRMMTYCNKSIMDAPGLKDERFLALSSAARSLLLSMLADDPRVRPTCPDVLRHEFITAVDSNAEAQREMGETVRRRMRDLAQLRRVHGLRYALRVHKPHGADHQAFLEALDQRRLKLKSGATNLGRLPFEGGASSWGFGPPSVKPSGIILERISDSGLGGGAGGGGSAGWGGLGGLQAGHSHSKTAWQGSSSAGRFARASEPPEVMATTRGGGGGGGGTGGDASPFARCSLATSYALTPGVMPQCSRDGGPRGRGGTLHQPGGGAGPCSAASGDPSLSRLRPPGTEAASASASPPTGEGSGAGTGSGGVAAGAAAFDRAGSSNNTVANTPVSPFAILPPSSPTSAPASTFQIDHQPPNGGAPRGATSRLILAPVTPLPRVIVPSASCSSLPGGAGIPPLPLAHAGTNSPDLRSLNMGVPVSAALAARPPGQRPAATGPAAGADATAATPTLSANCSSPLAALNPSSIPHQHNHAASPSVLVTEGQAETRAGSGMQSAFGALAREASGGGTGTGCESGYGNGNGAADGDGAGDCDDPHLPVFAKKSRGGLVLLNALPSLQHCMSMDDALGLEAGPEQHPGGGSPVAPPEVLWKAGLNRCMSANPLTLELLARRESLERILTRVNSDLSDPATFLMGPPLPAVGAHAAHQQAPEQDQN